MTNFMILTQNFLGGTESNHEIRQPSSWCPNQDFKTGPPENRTGVAKTREGKSYRGSITSMWLTVAASRRKYKSFVAFLWLEPPKDENKQYLLLSSQLKFVQAYRQLMCA
jgi:hypothetical protein